MERSSASEASSVRDRIERMNYLWILAAQGMGHVIDRPLGGYCIRCGEIDLYAKLDTANNRARSMPRCPYGEV